MARVENGRHRGHCAFPRLFLIFSNTYPAAMMCSGFDCIFIFFSSPFKQDTKFFFVCLFFCFFLQESKWNCRRGKLSDDVVPLFIIVYSGAIDAVAEVAT